MPDTRQLILYLLLLSPLALAREQNHTCQGGHNCNDGGVGVEQGQEQGQTQQQEQTQAQMGSVEVEAVGGTATADSLTSVSINNTPQGKTRVIKNTPDPYAPAVYPTVPCFKGASGGATGPGWGVSLGGGKIDPECNEREWIRMAPTVALRIHAYCLSSFALERFTDFDECVGQQPDPAAVERNSSSSGVALAQVSQREAQDIRYEQREQQQIQQQQVQLLDRLDRRMREADAREKERERHDADFKRGVKEISEYGK